MDSLWSYYQFTRKANALQGAVIQGNTKFMKVASSIIFGRAMLLHLTFTVWILYISDFLGSYGVDCTGWCSGMSIVSCYPTILWFIMYYIYWTGRVGFVKLGSVRFIYSSYMNGTSYPTKRTRGYLYGVHSTLRFHKMNSTFNRVRHKDMRCV
jgi:hypothetical protein